MDWGLGLAKAVFVVGLVKGRLAVSNCGSYGVFGMVHRDYIKHIRLIQSMQRPNNTISYQVPELRDVKQEVRSGGDVCCSLAPLCMHCVGGCSLQGTLQ